MRNNKKLKAFSMLNTMIAILIAGLLTAMAVPAIMNNVTKAKQAEAKTQLEHLYSLERLHFMEFSKYSPDFEAIDFEQQPLV
jgi:type IV pilus assembly protein PilE